MYVPHVAGAQVDQTIEFHNSDAFLHNVHGSPKDSRGWNVALSRQGAERKITVDHPEVMISVRCDLHPWMQGWLGVVDHPYFGVTGPDGRVTMPNVPAGDYTIGVWHERFGTKEAKVTVAPKGTTSTNVAARPPESPRVSRARGRAATFADDSPQYRPPNREASRVSSVWMRSARGISPRTVATTRRCSGTRAPTRACRASRRGSSDGGPSGRGRR